MADSKIVLGPYNLANIFSQFKDKNGNYVFNINDSISIDLTDTSSTLYYDHIVAAKDTYHTISYRYYGTTRLWWLIAKMNNVTDATKLPEKSTVLKVLNPAYINIVLSSIKE